jgi:hypothetical protein
MARYLQPDWFTRNIFNRAVAGLTRLGISVWGSRILRVRGRTTGQWRSTPVNLLTHQGARYLVAPRGNTQWVRNLRATGRGEGAKLGTCKLADDSRVSSYFHHRGEELI